MLMQQVQSKHVSWCNTEVHEVSVSFHLSVYTFLKKQQMKEPNSHIKPLPTALQEIFLSLRFALKEPVAKWTRKARKTPQLV